VTASCGGLFLSLQTSSLGSVPPAQAIESGGGQHHKTKAAPVPSIKRANLLCTLSPVENFYLWPGNRPIGSKR
jgi:hypothetical protein